MQGHFYTSLILFISFKDLIVVCLQAGYYLDHSKCRFPATNENLEYRTCCYFSEKGRESAADVVPKIKF